MSEAKAANLMQRGTVSLYSESIGYGFITPDDGGEDVFVHNTTLSKGRPDGVVVVLKEGQQVEFLAEFDAVKKKFKSTKVTAIGGVALPAKGAKRKGRESSSKQGKNKRAKTNSGKAVKPFTEETQAEIVKQVEYYLSDKNLAKDTWMRDVVTKSGNNSVPVTALLRCNKLRILTNQANHVVDSVAAAADTYKLSDDKTSILLGKELPAFTPPFTLLLTNVAEGQTWKTIRHAILNTYNTTPRVVVGEVSVVVLDADSQEIVEALVAKGVTDAEGKEKVADVEHVTDAAKITELTTALQTGLKANQAAKSKAKEAKQKKTKKKSIPLEVNGETFATGRKGVFDHVRSILNKYENDTEVDSTDSKFLDALFAAHPNASTKLVDFKAYTISEPEGFDSASRCFHIIKTDGTKIDISFIKALNSLVETAEAAAKATESA